MEGGDEKGEYVMAYCRWSDDNHWYIYGSAEGLTVNHSAGQSAVVPYDVMDEGIDHAMAALEPVFEQAPHVTEKDMADLRKWVGRYYEED